MGRLTIGIRNLAEVSIGNISLHRTIGGYDLVIGLVLNVNSDDDAPDAPRSAIIIGAQVSVGAGSGDPQRLGFARPEEPVVIASRPHHWRASHVLYLHLHPNQLFALEELPPVRIEFVEMRARGDSVGWSAGEIVIRRGPETRTPAPRGLENWLRIQARSAIAGYLPVVTARIGQEPGRVYVMGQRTKWGNCSSRRDLSFNWRLILAPDFVLRYLVAHEAVHLAVPDHSAKFWLTVQSLCPEAERAKQWLSRHHAQLNVDLANVVGPVCTREDGARQ